MSFFFVIKKPLVEILKFRNIHIPYDFEKVFFRKTPYESLWEQIQKHKIIEYTFSLKKLEITILDQHFIRKHEKMRITIFEPILIFEKCKKLSLLLPCKLKIQILLHFTMYNVRYNL